MYSRSHGKAKPNMFRVSCGTIVMYYKQSVFPNDTVAYYNLLCI